MGKHRGGSRFPLLHPAVVLRSFPGNTRGGVTASTAHAGGGDNQAKQQKIYFIFDLENWIYSLKSTDNNVQGTINTEENFDNIMMQSLYSKGISMEIEQINENITEDLINCPSDCKNE